MIRNRTSGGGSTTRTDRTTRRYGPHRVSYKWLGELLYYRELYLEKYNIDLCDYHPYSLYKKYLEDDTLFGEENSDDEETATEEEVNNEIHVTKVDLNPKANSEAHHTSDYKCTKARTVDGKKLPAEYVFRRGQGFKVDLSFDRKYEEKVHDLKLQFKLGMEPSVSRGTEISIKVSEKYEKFDNSGKWQARIVNKMPASTLELEILSAPSCIIGEWDLHIYTITKDKRGQTKELHYKHDEDIIILFNPWCKEDPVYFPIDPDMDTDVDPRDEYVLNPVGGVYRTGQRHKAWRYGQFDDGILQICLKLARRYFKGNINQEMGNPIAVSRAITSMVNSSDNDGVLTGRWDGNYSDGEKPGSWAGSTKILYQFRDTKQPVKYGQCWVFSALTVTVCRALGLPCRSITNYSSAHDADMTLEIERVITDTSRGYEALGGDSVWNFHVWNEAWMTRPDIGENKFNGWQVIDATPQESSEGDIMTGATCGAGDAYSSGTPDLAFGFCEGMYRCGPCPVRAVKEGLTYLPHDTGFVFAEVNSDIVYYTKTSTGLRRLKSKTESVGEDISTKKPTGEPISNYWDRYDCTKHYKHKEGTREERMAVARAVRYAGNWVEEVKEEVSINIKKMKERVQIGDDINVSVTVKNTSDDKERRMKIRKLIFAVSSIDYTGTKRIVANTLEKFNFYINPDEEQVFDLKTTWDDYADKRQDQSTFSVTVIVTVDKSNNSFPENKIISLDNPILDLQGPDTCRVGDEIKVKLTMKNPLPIPLTKCVLKIDDEKFRNHDDVKEADIQPKGSWTDSITLTAIRPGKGQVIAVMDTKELPDIENSFIVNITE